VKTQAPRAALALAFLLAAPAAAEDLSLRIPAYHPPLGVETTYRVEIETGVDSHGLAGGAGTMKGVFFDRVTAMETIPGGYRLKWRLEPQPGPKAEAGLVEIFRDRIEAFGGDSMVVLTDARGAPTKVENLDAIRTNLQRRVESIKDPADPSKGRLGALLQKLQPGSLFPVDVLAPPARLFVLAQQAADKEFEIGVTDVANAEGQINAAAVPYKLSTRIDADRAARTATFRWTKTFDATALADAWSEVIERETSDLRAKRPDTPAAQWDEFKGASLVVQTTVRLSLDDGVAVFAEEIVDNRTGPIFVRNVLRATRQ
jgi:hypothetical protein